jgi:hypothetical protein
MRSPVDLTIRSFKSAAANWQLVVIRMVESVVFVFLVLMALLATIIPVAIKAGLGKLKLSDADNAIQAVSQFLVEQLPLILWTFGVLIFVTGVMMIIHSLIVAGSARVYLDAERAPNDAFEVFRGESFWAAARRGFWRVFWIYNIAWSVALLLILLPVMVSLVVILVMQGTTASVIIAIVIFGGCVAVSIPIGIITSIWVGRAIIDGERSQLPAREALRVARRSIRADLGNHIVVMLLLMVVSVFAILFISACTNSLSMNGDVFWPMQWFGSLAQTIASSLAGAWMLAAFAALAENKPSV